MEIFLYEGDPDAAWHEARTGGCSDRLWLQLANIREKERPENAALVTANAAMRRLDGGAEFVRHLDALRDKYKIKRHFIQLVEEKRQLLYGS